jgi:hypothetical protein
MTDIVEKLHRGEGCLEEGGKTCISMDAESGCLCAIAADEITRLRAEVERLKSDRASAEPDWFWRDLDPDDSGDTVEEALRHMPQGVVCHIRSSYIGPSFFAATVPVLDADSDDQEYIRADTEDECRALVRAALNLSQEPRND